MTAPVSKPIKPVRVQKKRNDATPKSQKHHQCIGISRGGRNTKLHAIVDGLGNPLHVDLTAGNVHDAAYAMTVLEAVEIRGSIVMADKAYGSRKLREYIVNRGATYCIPPKSNTVKPWDFDPHQYRERHLIECFFNRLKENRRIATRYDKLASSFLAFVHLACARILLA